MLDQQNQKKRKKALNPIDEELEEILENDNMEIDEDGAALVKFGESTGPVLGAEDDIPELSPWVNEAAVSSKCPLCNKAKCIRVSINRAHQRATVRCLKCGESYTTTIKPLDAPVDVFCAWIDELTPQAMLVDGCTGSDSTSSKIQKGGKWLGWTSPVACLVNSYGIPRADADRYAHSLTILGVKGPNDFTSISDEKYYQAGWKNIHVEYLRTPGRPRYPDWNPTWALTDLDVQDKQVAALSLPVIPKLSLETTNQSVSSPSTIVARQFAKLSTSDSIGTPVNTSELEAARLRSIRRIVNRHRPRRTVLADDVPTPAIAQTSVTPALAQ